ncbi:MAG: chromosomal replication initiator protein DnaA [Acidobacteria bacterium]|nr:chromosomal replication initiator protein DnaA [Acidobacteriota bacterium]
MASSEWNAPDRVADGNLWRQALAQVRSEAGAGPIPPWLLQANPASADASRLEVCLPEAVPSATVSAALRAALEKALEKSAGRHIELYFRSGGAPSAPPANARPEPAAEERSASWPTRFQPDDRVRLNPQYTFENFVTGPCNRMAHAASLAVGDLPGRAYNPLFLHANVGLGKSHLIQAICHKILFNRPGVSMMYISCEDFVNQFIAAIERGQIEDFRYRFRYLDVLVIDDIHFLADKDRTQEEFFHTFNTLYQAQKQVVLSSDSPPHEIPRLEDRLVSRFKWGLVVRIDRPSFETRVAIVQKKSRLRGVDLPDDVIQYIATVVDTNNRELEGAVVRVLGYASLSNRLVDIDLAKEALRDLVVSPSRNLSIQAIADSVLLRYNARLSDLQSKKRSQSITLPRQMCMYLARRLTNRSLEEIGAFFGGRDHTTVLHSERKIKHLVEHDSTFRGLVDAIERDILRS